MNERRGRVDTRGMAVSRSGSATRRPSGPRIGPIAITPVRLALFVALIGSVVYIIFALTVRDASQIPMLSSGAAVLGIVFVGLAGVAFVAIRRAGREGRDGRAVALALLGGFSAIVGFVGIAAAVVLALVWRA